MINNVKVALRAARINAGLTQKQAAVLLRIGVSTLQGYESGRSMPRWDTALRLGSLYGMPCEILLAQSGAKFPEGR
ncbi:MAG: helix-turn-helix domain-containing protein [Oscillospiraceae bacterium]|jgi:transcriptional regulator with XRE-family HTH domain|nr:helix-turn-helix domain-containing protein [Oscillospiraceae bacterium]